MANFFNGKKTYIAALMGILTIACDMYNHGVNPANTMALMSQVGVIWGRWMVNPAPTK